MLKDVIDLTYNLWSIHYIIFATPILYCQSYYQLASCTSHKVYVKFTGADRWSREHVQFVVVQIVCPDKKRGKNIAKEETMFHLKSSQLLLCFKENEDCSDWLRRKDSREGEEKQKTASKRWDFYF